MRAPYAEPFRVIASAVDPALRRGGPEALVIETHDELLDLFRGLGRSNPHVERDERVAFLCTTAGDTGYALRVLEVVTDEAAAKTTVRWRFEHGSGAAACVITFVSVAVAFPKRATRVVFDPPFPEGLADVHVRDDEAEERPYRPPLEIAISPPRIPADGRATAEVRVRSGVGRVLVEATAGAFPNGSPRVLLEPGVTVTKLRSTTIDDPRFRPVVDVRAVDDDDREARATLELLSTGGRVALRARFAFDGVTGSQTFRDETGRFHAQNHGMYPVGTPRGPGLQWRANGQWLGVPEEILSHLPAGALACWLRRDEASALRFFAKVEPGVFSELGIHIDPDGTCRFHTQQRDMLTARLDLPIGVFRHLVFAWGPSGKRVFVDGDVAASDRAPAFVGGRSSRSFFGVDPNNPGGTGSRGTIVDVRFYEGEVSDDVTALFT